MGDRIQIRRDTAANWTSANPVLAQGEEGWETDTGLMKIGDGSTTWTLLTYAFIPMSQKGANSGVATLDSSGVVAQNPKLHASRHANGGADPLYAPINAKLDFGAKGDGTTDDTTALQNFINYCLANGRHGYIPAGTYKITATLNFSYVPGWRIEGAGVLVTTIKQATDNIAIFNLGSDNVSLMHHFTIANLSLNYVNTQTTANTSAIPILFSKMVYEGRIAEMSIDGGYYGMQVASGIGGPWGMTFDDITFGNGLQGGAMDWSSATSGVPNNHFGRLYVDASNMHDAKGVFNLRGYNARIDTIEVTGDNNGVPVLITSSQSKWSIGTMKLEIGTFNPGAGNSITLFDFSAGSTADIDYIFVGGTTMVVNSGTVYILGTPTSPTSGYVTCSRLEAALSAAPTGTCYLLGATSPIVVNTYSATNISGLTNVGATTSCDLVTVRNDINGKASYEKGNTDYTVALGDPNVIMCQTAMTAPHTITLPSTQFVWTGLYYDIVVNGAAPSVTNPLTIKSGTRTLATVTSDKVRLRFAWRRNSASDYTLGWTLIGQIPLGAPTVATKTASYTATAADSIIVMNGSSLTLTLPDPTTVAPGSVQLTAKNVNASALTVASAGTSKTVDGAASVTLAQWATAVYVSDGTQWLSIG